MTTTSCPNNRILVIDDEQTIHEAYRTILCPRQGSSASLDAMDEALFGKQNVKSEATRAFDVDVASQGRDGAALLGTAVREGKPYAMAFVDMRMPPGWNGVDTIKGIWRLDPAVQIVLSTAYSDFTWDKVLAAVGRSAGLHLLRKPFDPAQVLRFAEVLCRKWQLAAESRLIASGLQR